MIPSGWIKQSEKSARRFSAEAGEGACLFAFGPRRVDKTELSHKPKSETRDHHCLLLESMSPTASGGAPSFSSGTVPLDLAAAGIVSRRTWRRPRRERPDAASVERLSHKFMRESVQHYILRSRRSNPTASGGAPISNSACGIASGRPPRTWFISNSMKRNSPFLQHR